LACTYPEQPGTASLPAKKTTVHDRIVQLERLVMSLIPGQAPNPGVTPNLDEASSPSLMSRSMSTTIFSETTASTQGMQTPMDVHSECGSMHVRPSDMSYVGGEHWAAILDSIAVLKDHFEQDEEFRLSQDNHEALNPDGADRGPELPSSQTLLLYGPHWPVSRLDILAALPPKSSVDRYVSRYFNRLDLVHCQWFSPPSN
jgi:hypothetical protein